MEKIIARGAEAIIYKTDNQVIKDRISKSYRLTELDNKIRKRRTKKETKLLEKASKLIPTPLPKESKDQTKIEMPFIDGKKLSEHLDSLPNKNQICEQIGKQIAILHDNEIIHGDLTTSNMILSNRGGGRGERMDEQIFFIDFGLGYESRKDEDKAVDLHLIKQALEARHYQNYESYWKNIVSGYKSSKNSEKILERLKTVESRGRYKEKY
jgi:Kae1-associated kinase Bud32